MDSIDRIILNRLQFDFPLTTRPFAAIAGETGIPERAVLDRIAALKRKNIIRQISVIFDSSKIGYHSVLAAFRVGSRRIDSVAQVVNLHPGISHNYRRRGVYDLWFTLTLPRTRDLKREITRLAACSGVKEWLFLPMLRKFKIGFTLDMGGGSASTAARGRPERENQSPSKRLVVDKAFVRELQKDLPLATRPFHAAARQLGVTEAEVVRMLKRYLDSGVTRRIAAVLRPAHAGYASNVLTVWAPGHDKTELMGRIAAGQKCVSHCYERPTLPGWPYSVYAMVHGRSMVECRKMIRAIARISGVKRYRELVTLQEYKKIRVEYFPENPSRPDRTPTQGSFSAMRHRAAARTL